MEITLDCIPCMLKQALEASRMVTNDIEQQEKIVEEALSILLAFKAYRNAPDLARGIQRIIKDITGTEDAYYDIKRRDLDAANKLYPFLQEFIKKQDGKLYWALKTAATGNNIDAAIYQDIDVKRCVEQELDKEFSVCDLMLFKDKLKAASNILILGDNTGETVFDKILIESLPDIPVTYGVRSEPILNDATIQEAYDSGLGEVSRIVSTGCNAPGTILEECNKEFITLFHQADLIISKGQGNFEALSEQKGNLFFLLKAKCPMIANKLNVELNDYVFKYSGS